MYHKVINNAKVIRTLIPLERGKKKKKKGGKKEGKRPPFQLFRTIKVYLSIR